MYMYMYIIFFKTIHFDPRLLRAKKKIPAMSSMTRSA